MAKRKYRFDEAKIKKLRSEGHGLGSGGNYVPWLRARDFGSRGLTSRVLGWKSGREHHLFSKLEKQFFFLLEWCDSVVDIREQFPLDHHAARHFAEEAGINYPWERKTGYDVVMTTDFLVTVVDSAGARREVARTLKYAKDLRGRGGKGILEKFEVERRYWLGKGIDWGMVTDQEIPEPLVSNIEDCHGYRDLESAVDADARQVAAVEELLRRQPEEHGEHKLSAIAAMSDRVHSWERGKSLAIIRHLLANKRLTLPTNVRWLKDGRCEDIACG